MDYDVVVAGGGPVGLLLACELKLAGVSVVVLERLADPKLPIKAGGTGGRALNIPSVEVFYRRGLLPAVKRESLWWMGATDQKDWARTPTLAATVAAVESAASKAGKTPPKFVGHLCGDHAGCERCGLWRCGVQRTRACGGGRGDRTGESGGAACGAGPRS